MKRVFRRGAVFLLLLLWLPAGALALTGQTISTFLTYYKENVSQINEIYQLHMLSKDLSEQTDATGRAQYSYSDDILQVTVSVNTEGIIESCEIRLMYPENAVKGNSLYQDFLMSSYQGLAFIMSMHVSSDPVSRYYLGYEITVALNENHGLYERQLGAYSITCIGVVSEGAVFTFTNNGLTTTDTTTDDAQTPAPIEEEDEDARYG